MSTFNQESNLLGSKGPRKMQAVIPKVNGDLPEIWKPTNKEESLLACHKAGKKERLLSFINKTPKWNEGTMISSLTSIRAEFQWESAEAFC